MRSSVLDQILCATIFRRGPPRCKLKVYEVNSKLCLASTTSVDQQTLLENSRSEYSWGWMLTRDGESTEFFWDLCSTLWNCSYRKIFIGLLSSGCQVQAASFCPSMRTRATVCVASSHERQFGRSVDESEATNDYCLTGWLDMVGGYDSWRTPSCVMRWLPLPAFFLCEAQLMAGTPDETWFSTFMPRISALQRQPISAEIKATTEKRTVCCSWTLPQIVTLMLKDFACWIGLRFITISEDVWWPWTAYLVSDLHLSTQCKYWGRQTTYP